MTSTCQSGFSLSHDKKPGLLSAVQFFKVKNSGIWESEILCFLQNLKSKSKSKYLSVHIPII